MKRKIIFKELKNSKYKYIFLITIAILGIISGIALSNILSFNDKKEIIETINNYFYNLSNNKINYFKNFINYFNNNIIFLILIFIFSFGILGLIVNPFIIYIKSLIIGLDIGIMIYLYSYKGILLGLLFVFPEQIINLFIYVIMSFYGIKISINLFKLIFLKQQVNFLLLIKKYLKLSLISFIILLISAIYETFLGDLIINFFTFLIK